MLKVLVNIWQCECGKNIIILDENLQDSNSESDDILCPLCGEEMVGSMVRNLTITDSSEELKSL